ALSVSIQLATAKPSYDKGHKVSTLRLRRDVCVIRKCARARSRRGARSNTAPLLLGVRRGTGAACTTSARSGGSHRVGRGRRGSARAARTGSVVPTVTAIKPALTAFACARNASRRWTHGRWRRRWWQLGRLTQRVATFEAFGAFTVAQTTGPRTTRDHDCERHDDSIRPRRIHVRFASRNYGERHRNPFDASRQELEATPHTVSCRGENTSANVLLVSERVWLSDHLTRPRSRHYSKTLQPRATTRSSARPLPVALRAASGSVAPSS
ncbi:MAG: hypothetical protein RL701_697, partial [Pseudomonadota bacterium]